MNSIKNFYHKYKFVLLGISLILILFWWRFLRERIPREIPFNFNLISLCCLITVCITSCIILKNLIYKNFQSLDIFIQKKLFERDLQFIKIIYDYFYKKMILWFILFQIVPKLVLLVTLIIDIIIFNKLFLFYKFVYFSFFILLEKYILYIFKCYKEKQISFFKENARDICIDYNYEIYQQLENENDDEDFKPSMIAVPLELFINHFVDSKIKNNQDINYMLFASNKFLEDIETKTKNMTSKTANEYYSMMNKTLEDVFQQLLKLSLFIRIHNSNLNDSLNLKFINIVINSFYLLCWLYILLISIKTINTEEFFEILNQSWLQLTEPFSQTTCRYYKVGICRK